MDDFHAVWVPVQNVLNAWRASHGVGFGSVAIAVAEGPKSRVTCESVKELLGEEIPWPLSGMNSSTAPCPMERLRDREGEVLTLGAW